MATKYKEKFKKHLAKHGADDPGDVDDDHKKDFFKEIDKKHTSKPEKADKDGDGVKRNDQDESVRTRAGRLLNIHNGIEEDFYKKGKGDAHRNRNANGMGNIRPRNTSNSSSAASDTTSHVAGVNIGKPGIEGSGKMSSGDGGTDLNWVS